eukprot:gene39782-49163_t
MVLSNWIDKKEEASPEETLRLFHCLSKCKSLEKLTIGFDHRFCAEGYMQVVKECSNLQEFEYHSFKVNTFTIKFNRGESKKLELKLSDMDGKSDELTCDLLELFSGFTNISLQSFDMSDKAFGIVARNNPLVNELWLYKVGKTCSYEAVSDFLQKCTALEKLLFYKFDHFSYAKTVKLLCSGVISGVHLLNLDLYFDLSTEQAIKILEGNPQITEFSLWKCYEIS